MKKQLVIIGITLVLLAVVLSGCESNPLNIDTGGDKSTTPPDDNQQDKGSTTVGDIEVYGDIDKIEILNVEAITQEMNWYGNWVKVSEGFVYLPYQGFRHQFNVAGTAKNIAGETIDSMTIIVQYCDAKGEILNQEINDWCYKNSAPLSPSFGYRCKDISDGDTCDFELTFKEYWVTSTNPYNKVHGCKLIVDAKFP